MSTKLDTIKHNGAICALRTHMDSLKHRLCNQNWSNITDGVNYIRMGEAINDAEDILDEMSETLKALKELNPENK